MLKIRIVIVYIFVIIKIVKVIVEIKYWFCVYLYLDFIFIWCFYLYKWIEKSDCKLIYIFNFLVGFSLVFFLVKKIYIIVDGIGILNVLIFLFIVVVFCECGM